MLSTRPLSSKAPSSRANLLVDAFGQAVVDVEVSAPVCFVPVVGPAHLGAVLGAVAAEADEFRLVRDGLEVGGERREFDVGREIDDVAPLHHPVADVVGVCGGKPRAGTGHRSRSLSGPGFAGTLRHGLSR